MSQETIPNGSEEQFPGIDESGFEPLLPHTPEKVDTPADIRITAGMGIEFLDPETKEVREGRVMGIPGEGTEITVHVESSGTIFEIPLIDVQQHIFDVLTREKTLRALGDAMN
jgi:hypothetical protein